jgi:hypothetical protein
MNIRLFNVSLKKLTQHRRQNEDTNVVFGLKDNAMDRADACEQAAKDAKAR